MDSLEDGGHIGTGKGGEVQDARSAFVSGTVIGGSEFRQTLEGLRVDRFFSNVDLK